MRLLLLVLLLAQSASAATKMLLQAGPVNGVLLEADGKRLAVYGWNEIDLPEIEYVLLAHGRRDVVWKARAAITAGAQVVAPERERYSLENGPEFWAGFSKSRFHDYAQQSTKILNQPLKVARWIKDGDIFEWQGLPIKVLETPGFTRGSASFVTRIDGKQIAFTGDLIYGDGQILDLYSFQDAIPEAQIRGYHGYGARLADLVTSLRKIAAVQPDVIVPQGPVIDKPAEAIARLIERVEALYRNYLSTSALHWYFKEDRMRQCGERILGTRDGIDLMPYSHHEQTPAWIFEHSTSRLLISDTGNAFLLDCGYQRVIDAVNDLIEQDVIKQVEGIFVTHYHDDHTDMVQTAAETFRCPVYATSEYADVLARPEAYHLPAMTANPIRDIQVLPDGHNMKWHEFELEFHFFPGQTYFHGAVLAKKPGQKPVFFIGDAFAPSGLDDYCVLNRNLLHDDAGYLLCLQKLRAIKEPFWLVNEHIPFVFSFSREELDYLEQRYRDRIAIMRELFPWDDPNYGIDAQWATLYPHGSVIESGQPFGLEVRITNHSPVERTFEITPHLPRVWKMFAASYAVRLPPGESKAVRLFEVTPLQSGTHVITASIASDGMEFREWLEAVVTVK